MEEGVDGRGDAGRQAWGRAKRAPHSKAPADFAAGGHSGGAAVAARVNPAPSPPRDANAAEDEGADRSARSVTSTPGSSRPRRRFRLRRREEEGYDRPFERWARWLLARGVHPNHFTFLQLPVFAFQIAAAIQGWAWAFVACIALIIVLDGGDGILARTGNLYSKTGAVLDSTFDTLGIAIVMWGAAQFFPAAEAWFMVLFLGNTLLFLQNALLGDKVIAYIRGPVLVAIAFPATLVGGLVLASLILLFLLVARTPRSLRALGA